MKILSTLLVGCLIFASPVSSVAQSKTDVLRALQGYRASGGGLGGGKDPSSFKMTGNQNGLNMSSGGSVSGAAGMNYQIHVLGQVESPGTFRFGPSVRVAEAVAGAGNVIPGGSMRHIELRRGSDPARKIDLFRFVVYGDLNFNPFLQDNDVIYVPFAKNSVRIEGPVKKGGTYELVEEKNIWDVIQLAGGYASGASEDGEVVIVRYVESDKKELIKVANIQTELLKTELRGGDIIVVPHIFTKDKEFDYAFPELPADNIFYPSYNDNVFVIGAVTQPGSYPYNAHLGIMQYINMAGPGANSKIQSARVMATNGKVIRRPKGYTLNPGDTIVVPEKKLNGGNFLAWYNTFASTVFTAVALRSLLQN